jgi:hypothetical protein
MQFLLAERGGADRYRDVEVVQVGLPFRQYPLFEDFEADYIIAAPTVFSFHSEREKHDFLRTVVDLVDQIPRTARIAYKTHNGNAKDYFAPRLQYAIGRALNPLPGTRALLEALAGSAPKGLKRGAESTLTGMLHMKATARAVSMPHLTPYADMSLEAFLPRVRGGVIGGLSNVIWGTLYSGLTYYNCIRPDARSGKSELLPNRSSDILLDTNLKFFGVPWCEGRLDRGARGENIVTEEDRHGDILQAIQADLSYV